MADLQQRLNDFQQQIEDISKRVGREDVSDAVAQLERTARELLADAKNTPQERTAQELFAQVARLNSPTSTTAATVRGLLRRARIRIEIAGDDDDIDEAVDILSEALALNPSDEDTIAMLQQAAAQTPQANQRVSDLFKRHGVERPSRPPEPEPPAAANETNRPATQPTRSNGDVERYASYAPVDDDNDDEEDYPPPPRQNKRRTTGTQAAISYSSDVDDLLSDLTQAYYAGEYQQTVDIANRILAQQPNNPTAIDYREKSEDNLIRGVVPDHRIPFDARVSYNRANSLVRAGNYEEAEKLYREARDLAERSGILSWKDAEQAMLDIQDLALARELLNEGDRLMAADNWSEAVRKYEGALRVVQNDPQAEERLEKIRRIQQDADQAAVQLSMLSGSLSEQGTQLQNAMNILARARQLLPGSQRLGQLQTEANNKLAGLKTQIYDQSQSAMSRAGNATSLDERLMHSNEALRLLELGVELDPSDARFAELMAESRTASSDTQRAKQIMERAAALIAQNFDTELAQARSMLADLQEYAQDERYRNVVNDLLSRHVERVEIALEDGNLAEAQAWLDTCKEDPFRILGRRAELQRLENQVRGERQRGRLIAGAIGGAIIIILGAALLLTRDQWIPVVNPPPTDTPTYTPTASVTPTPSVTPTASDTPTPSETPSDTPTATITRTPTDTPTATWTVTPSLTVTPSETPTETHTPTHTPTPTPSSTATRTPTLTLSPTITPTPLALCQVAVVNPSGINLRAQPTLGSARLALLPVEQIMDVVEQQRAPDGLIWYRIRTQIQGNQTEGWVRNDTVETFGSECPTVPTPEPDEG